MPKGAKRNSLRHIDGIMWERIKNILTITVCVLGLALMLFIVYLGILNAWTWGY